MGKNQVREYYENTNFCSVFEKTDSKFKHFRSLTNNGAMIKIQKTINDGEDFSDAVLTYFSNESYPIQIYFGTSRFLDPETVGPRSGPKGKGFRDRLLYQDTITLDLDENPQKNALKSIEFLEERNKNINYIIFSGGSGIHINFDRELELDFLRSEKREKETLKANKKLAKKLEEAGIEIEPNTVINTRHIYRVPLSLDATTGRACIFLDLDDLTEDWNEILNRAHTKVEGEVTAPVSLERDDDGQHRLGFRGSCVNQGAGRQSGASHLSTSSTIERGIRSSVIGSKGLHILVIPLKTRQLDLAKRKAESLIEKYNLSDIYLFDNGSKIVGVCLKCVSLRRFKKIADGQDLQKYENRILWLDDLELIDIVKGYPVQPEHISKAHGELFGVEGEAGSGKLKIVREVRNNA